MARESQPHRPAASLRDSLPAARPRRAEGARSRLRTPATPLGASSLHRLTGSDRTRVAVAEPALPSRATRARRRCQPRHALPGSCAAVSGIESPARGPPAHGGRDGPRGARRRAVTAAFLALPRRPSPDPAVLLAEAAWVQRLARSLVRDSVAADDITLTRDGTATVHIDGVVLDPQGLAVPDAEVVFGRERTRTDPAADSRSPATRPPPARGSPRSKPATSPCRSADSSRRSATTPPREGA